MVILDWCKYARSTGPIKSPCYEALTLLPGLPGKIKFSPPLSPVICHRSFVASDHVPNTWQSAEQLKHRLIIETGFLFYDNMH